MSFVKIGLIAAGVIASTSAQAAVITFNNLQPDPGQFYGSFTTYTEAGYTATNHGNFSGSFFSGYQNYAGFTPRIVGQTGYFSITGPSPFSLTSFDAYEQPSGPNTPPSDYTVTGYLFGVPVYSYSGTIAVGPTSLANSDDTPYTTYSGFSSVKFDRVDIALSGNNTYFDNITLDAAVPVPELASWAMMIAGMGAIGYAMRRRRERVTVRYA